MLNFDNLKKRLQAKGFVGKNGLIYASARLEAPKILKLRDNLLRLGDIVEEDLDNSTYISTVKTGLTDFDVAYVAAQLSGNWLYIACSADEGMINQNKAEKALEKLTELYPELHQIEDDVKKPKKKHGFFFWTLCFVLVISVVAFSGFYLKQYSAKTIAYNKLTSDYNKAAFEYNRLLPMVSVSNISGLFENLPIIQESDTNAFALIKTIINGNTCKKIDADIVTMKALIGDIEEGTRIIKQINAPEDSWVLQVIQPLEKMTDSAMVTADNDPNQMLNKEGGYTGCVYFTLSSVASEDAPGSNALEKGTDGGGAIEIYPSLQDAQNRCDYLAQYDGTLLYSGSYAIIGTMVIRTSYALDVNEQFEVTDSLTKLLTA